MMMKACVTGVLNTKGKRWVEMKQFIKICKMSQSGVKKYVSNKLAKMKYNVISEDGFVYAKGNLPVLLTAHMDTVHKELVKHVVIESDVISSPQGIGGDDRCGIWIILRLLSETNLRPSILFCEDEEIGSNGARKFVKSKYVDDLYNLNYLVELDRHGSNDAVYYSCANVQFINFIERETGYVENLGTWSDICELSEYCDLASVNLSCGYYNEHHLEEKVMFNEMVNTKEVVKQLLKSPSTGKFDYMPNYYHEYNQDFYNKVTSSGALYIRWRALDGNIYECDYYGNSSGEAMVDFLESNPEVCWNDVVEYVFY